MFFIAEDMCPKCKTKGQKVEHETLMCHLKDISKIDKEKNYYFCWNENCENIYFTSAEGLTQEDVIREVGYKASSSENGIICFCFNYTKANIKADSFKEKKLKVKLHGCNCSLRNPSGGCCTSFFKNYVKERFGETGK
ncbi:hypothetical protein [Nitrosophilus alvini]|uniref:hypothetical protein n=1 Tax=Nitrosophilus alvini TaxID=2714855 RepID=UPI00190C671E|nr:hypothetical protein [Nitrosophilus alvini]